MNYSLIIATVMAMAVAGGLLAFNNTRDLSVPVLGFTAVYIAWYSLETSELRRETSKLKEETQRMQEETRLANIISIQPGVLMQYHKFEDGVSLALVNVGKGAAMNIKVASLNSPTYKFSLRQTTLLPEDIVPIRLIQGESVVRMFGEKLTANLDRGPEFIDATILFDRIKARKKHLKTEVRIKLFPNVETRRIEWGL